MTITKTIKLFSIALFIFGNVLAQQQNHSKKYRILTYGLPDDARSNAKTLIADKWNIEFYSVGGCMVSNELEDSVKAKNGTIYKAIEGEYGTGWEEKFYSQVEDEYNN